MSMNQPIRFHIFFMRKGLRRESFKRQMCALFVPKFPENAISTKYTLLNLHGEMDSLLIEIEHRASEMNVANPHVILVSCLLNIF